jgi:hypothetical protein
MLASIEPSRKGFPIAYTLAYFASSSVTKRKSPTLVLAPMLARIEPSRQGFPRAKTLDYFASSLVTARKSPTLM